MKILYHHRTASKDGQNVHIEELIAALRRQGHEVVVVAPPSRSEFGHDGGLVPRIRRALPAAIHEQLELAYSIHAYRQLLQAWKRHRPDVMYERYNLFYLPGLWLKRRTGIPWLVEINAPLAAERGAHGGLALPRLAQWTERAVWCGADAALPVTGVLARHVRQSGVPEDRITVIHNGIDRSHFSAAVDGQAVRRELGLDGKVVLGFTGFIREWHGLPQVVDAMKALPANVHFLVVGDGPARGELEAHAARLGMAERVTCLGLVGRDRVAACIKAFDVALQPQAVDYASPLKLFEYMALSRAILAPDQSNIREVLADGHNALLFRHGDFAQQLARLCGDTALRSRLGQAAHDDIERQGRTWDANAARITKIASRIVIAGRA
ncbi:MAG: glycosyltransferase family 4 protein [Rhodospirillaceae bacterium]|nr:glycosyltransferase family 4 protein [Rhodospirillales bacterium]